MVLKGVKLPVVKCLYTITTRSVYGTLPDYKENQLCPVFLGERTHWPCGSILLMF